MQKKHLLAALIIFNFWTRALAQPLLETEATPSVLLEPESRLLITEVNFKNSEADWIEIYYESPSGRGLNLSGITFADDGKFKTVTDFTAQSGQYVLLTFKSALPDNPPFLNTVKSGLTGTTEQVVIYDKNGKVLDAVCWTSSTPTTDEITDMMDLYGLYGWHTADTSGCIKSESVKNNESIARIGFLDTNSASDWEVTENITPGAVNAVAEETYGTANEEESTITKNGGEETEYSNDEMEIDALLEETGNSEIETEPIASPQTPGPITQAEAIKTAAKNTAATPAAAKTTAAKKTTTSKSKSSATAKTAYANGDFSEDIIISELLPNPKGDDSKNEWIEITNTGEEDINLGNWSLDKGEGSAKPFVFSDTTVIGAGKSLLASIKESKISLTNKGGTVRLLDFEGNTVNEINYEQSPEDQSYCLIPVTLEDGTQSNEWFWTGDPTPGEPNPPHREITAEILEEPQFEEKYFFRVASVKDKPGDRNEPETFSVYFSEDLLPAPLAKATLITGTSIKMMLRENGEGDYVLVRYEILSPPAEEKGGDIYATGIIGSLVTAAGSAIYFLRKKIPWPAPQRIPLSKQADT